MKQMLYIMCGRTFAGKTTLRNKIVKRYGFSIASVDQNIDKHGFKVENMSQDDWNLVYSETYDKLKKLLREGETTILDLGNLEKHERDTARAIAQDLKIPYKLIYVDTSEDEVKRRWENNQRTEGARKMHYEVFKKAQAMFEKPTEDEHPVIYNSAMELEGWLKQNVENDFN